MASLLFFFRSSLGFASASSRHHNTPIAIRTWTAHSSFIQDHVRRDRASAIQFPRPRRCCVPIRGPPQLNLTPPRWLTTWTERTELVMNPPLRRCTAAAADPTVFFLERTALFWRPLRKMSTRPRNWARYVYFPCELLHIVWTGCRLDGHAPLCFANGSLIRGASPAMIGPSRPFCCFDTHSSLFSPTSS